MYYIVASDRTSKVYINYRCTIIGLYDARRIIRLLHYHGYRAWIEDMDGKLVK